MTRCVYTVLTGDYESLNEQPAAADSSVPFICFTDNPNLRSETWEFRELMPVFPQDPVRSQRRYKLLAHEVLPEFEASLYIDNSVLLSVPPEEIFADVDLAAGLSLPAHSFRASVLDEFVEVAADRLDNPQRISEQLAHYKTTCREVLLKPPFWTAILLRDHGNEAMRAAMNLWLAQIYRYSRRDQLSVNFALHEAGVQPDVLQIDNHKSWFHSWPHGTDRKTEQRLWPEVAGAAETIRLQAEIFRLEQQLAALQHAHETVLNSTSWRLLEPLREVARRLRAGSN